MQISQARKQYIRWLRVTRDLSPHTIRAYDGDIAAFERHVGVRARVGEIDRNGVVAFIEQQRAAGLSSTSIKRRASGVRGFCRWLFSRRLLEADPWSDTTVVMSRSRRLPRTLPRHDLERLLLHLRQTAGIQSTVDPRDVLAEPHRTTTLLATSLMVATGVRVHEVVGIACRDIDLASRSVLLVGKGRRERQVYLTNDWIAELTDAYLTTRAELNVGHAYLLFNRRHRPLTSTAMRTRLATAAREAGLSSHVTPHMLRHTAATQLIEAGVDIRYIQRLLGHASLSTTEIYTHVSNRALRRVVSDADVLGGALGR